MKKLFLIATLICVFFCTSHCQQKISGSVKDGEGKPLPSASVTLYKKASPNLLAFAITNQQGNFIITHNETEVDSLELIISALGFGKQSAFFKFTDKNSFSFVLSPNPTYLPEIKIKTPPVWQKRDTLNYNASEFKQPQDRVIGDIIARLPGIEVTSSGQIKYNGRPINKYYIEGLDLLEDKYGIANNNLPAESVDKVQVLENHQPIRVLDSLNMSDRAALNIKLKSGAKMKLLGQGRLGLGLTPLLSENEVSVMLFKSKSQFINTYKYNNTGIDNFRELTSQNLQEYTNAIQNGAIKNDLLTTVQPTKPSLSPNRYLFNNSHVASINHLIALKKDYQLRINLSYTNDLQQQEGTNKTRIFLPLDTITIVEKHHYKNMQQMGGADFTLMANTPSYYFRNLTRLQVWKSSERGTISTANDVTQCLNNPFYNLANDFKLIRIRRKKVWEYSSYVGLTSLPQELLIEPGLYKALFGGGQPYEGLVQTASLRTFYTDNRLVVRSKKDRVSSQYTFGFNVQSQKFSSNLQLINTSQQSALGDTFQNHLQWLRQRYFAEASWQYEADRFRVAVSIPLHYVNINYSDPTYFMREGREGFFLMPTLNFQWQIGSFWSLLSSASYTPRFGDVQTISRGYMLRTYRNLSNNNSPLQQAELKDLSTGVTYRNPLTVVFWNAGIQYTHQTLNLLYTQTFNGPLETLTAIAADNTSNTTSLFSRFSKYVIDWKTSFSLNMRGNLGSRELIQQKIPLRLYNRNLIINPVISMKIGKRASIEYSASFFRGITRSDLHQEKTAFANSTQALSYSCNITDQWFLNAATEYYDVRTPQGNSRYFFADCNVRFKPNRSKFNLEFFIRNLADNRIFETILLQNNVETSSTFLIRPRQILAKVSFTF